MPSYNSGDMLFQRLRDLLDALADGPLDRRALLERLGSAYPSRDSGRRMLDRDITHLRTLGIVIERSRSRPPIYTFCGGTPHFDGASLRALSIIRQTFDRHHPQAAEVQRVVHTLTTHLEDKQREHYERRQRLTAPIEPAIDYAPYAALMCRLEASVQSRERLSFHYHALRQPRPQLHHHVEPYDIEFYDRHFYLVAYVPQHRQFFDFRIDRIADDASFVVHPPMPPGTEHERPLVQFRYRLAADIARGGVSQRFPVQRIVETLPNGDVIIEAEGRSDFFIIQTLLRYRANAELLEPAWLREKMREEITSLAKMYELF